MEQATPNGEWITVKEMQQLLSLSESKTREILVQEEGIETVQIGRAIRVNRASLERWLKEQRYSKRREGSVTANRSLEDTHAPLLCMVCEKDLTEWSYTSILVFIVEDDHEAYPRIVDAYWGCKNSCDGFMERALGEGRRLLWHEITDLMNPLEYVAWEAQISRLIEDGELSERAAAMVHELMSTLSWVASREPTEEHRATFRELEHLMMEDDTFHHYRMMEDL